MGIQDRDYYRNEGPSIFDSLMPSGLVCRWLIGINTAVFVLQMVAYVNAQTGEGPRDQGWVTEWFVLNVGDVLNGQVWRLLTYAFLHSTDNFFMHLLFNMLFLWWFGSDVEQLYGRKEFLAIYLVSAFLGGVTFELWHLARGELHYSCLGASGAVTTMLVLCALHYPRRIVYAFMLLPMPIWVLAIVNIGKDAFILLSGTESQVAVVVHLAGAGFAVAYYKWQRSIVEILRGLMWWKRAPRSRARLKLFNPDADAKEPVAVSANSVPQVVVDEHLEAKLDAILEKIAKTGKGSLTEQEQEILQQASQMYKKRRT